ncbi:multidrug effflux MFS transporter [Piscirickettsia salmonis]|uniref:multidrug effflux MFS transporter n=1 Tax=Piscirickettsia salmonis TaxID=1238 RepID=UPI003751EF93
MYIQQRNKLNFILVIFGVIAAQAAVSLYLPSLPAIDHEWHLASGQAQLTLSAFFLTFGVSQLFYGALSDHFGRKPLLLMGLVILVLSSVWAIYATSFHSLLAARLVQGVGGGALSVLARAIIRDLFHGDELRKAISILAIAASFTPALAPSLGGWLEDHFDWRSSFVILTAYSIILLVTIFSLFTETNQYQRQPNESIDFSKVVASYYFVTKNKLFWCYGFAILIGYLSLVICLANAPFLLEKKFGLSAEITGYLMFVQPGFFLVGNLLQHKLTDKISGDLFLKFGMVILGVIGLSFLLQGLFHSATLINVLLTLALAGFATSLILVNALAGVLLPFTENAGAAAALSGVLQMVGASFITALISNLHWTSIIDLGWIYLALFVVLYISLLFLHRIRLYSPCYKSA